MYMNDFNYYETISNAARDGKLYRLKVFLHCHPREDCSDLLSVTMNGLTPLMFACLKGHLDVVLYLIENCNANVNGVGLTKFKCHDKLLDVTALWCAALPGHFSIAKVLVKYNAAVNYTTKEKWTVLYAACLLGRIKVVKCLIELGADTEIATESGSTCVMIACYKRHYDILKYLLECGADINKKNLEGHTALHICIKSGSLDILKILLQHGAKIECDSYGFTPLLAAALYGHSDIIYFFMNEFIWTKQEKINALELLGATYMNEKQDMVAALKYWKHAMEIRFEDGKPPLEKPIVRSPIASYVNETEVRTLHELEEIIADSEKMKIQSLLYRERILGQRFPGNFEFIRIVGVACAGNSNFNKAFLLLRYALHVLEDYHEPLSSVTYNFLYTFTELFAITITDKEFYAGTLPPIKFKDVLYVFKRSLKEIETFLSVSTIQKDIDDTSPIHRTLIIIMHLLCIMCRLQPNLSRDEDSELKAAACALVNFNFKAKNGLSPLHLACMKDLSKSLYPALTFPSSKIVDLLLEVGACPNVVDLENNTPLHIIAMQKPFDLAIFKALFNHGARLDFCNSEKKTPFQLAGITSFSDINP